MLQRTGVVHGADAAQRDIDFIAGHNVNISDAAGNDICLFRMQSSAIDVADAERLQRRFLVDLPAHFDATDRVQIGIEKVDIEPQFNRARTTAVHTEGIRFNLIDALDVHCAIRVEFIQLNVGNQDGHVGFVHHDRVVNHANGEQIILIDVDGDQRVDGFFGFDVDRRVILLGVEVSVEFHIERAAREIDLREGSRRERMSLMGQERARCRQ